MFLRTVLRKYFKDFKVARFIVVIPCYKEVLEELLGRKIDPGAYLETLFSDF